MKYTNYGKNKMNKRYYFNLIADDFIIYKGHHNNALNKKKLAFFVFKDWIDRNVYEKIQLIEWDNGKEAMIKEHVSKNAKIKGCMKEFYRKCDLFRK